MEETTEKPGEQEKTEETQETVSESTSQESKEQFQEATLKSDSQETPEQHTKKEPQESTAKQTAEQPQKDKRKDKEGLDNVIFVGIKPFMNYVTGVVMQFQNKGQDEVIVSARGKFISKAVDVVEVARRTFLKEENIQIKDINIASEQFENKEGKRIFVSTIELILVKG